MARWLFARHGQSVANAEGWVSGHLDVALTERGREQARALGRALADVRVERAYCSDLMRARDTATLALAAHAITPTPVRVLRERHLGTWDGRHRVELVEKGLWETVLAWDHRPPGGESHHDCALRVLTWLAELDEVSHTLVVGHGSVFRCVIGLLEGDELADIGRRKVSNATLIIRDVPSGQWAELAKRLREHP